MNEGTFEDFLDALRAFESGWDRERYEAGIIAEWQLDQWAGGPVEDFFPQYGRWGDLSDAEWDAMSYKSMNTLGFVGYQFGEALLIDLGYYDDDFFYGNGAAANTWDGTWTGKNGATSLDVFKTAQVQDKAILDAFGYNLGVIENGLQQAGTSLDEIVGTTGSYVENGQTVSVELSLTGVLAAAHLRGAWGMLNLLLGGAVSTDEFGTSILQYVEQFGGYAAPTVDELITGWEAGKTGDEGLGTPDGGAGDGGDIGSGGGAGGNTGNGGSGGSGGAGGSGTGAGTGTAGVTAATADVVIDWAWGSRAIVTDFDPAASTIFVAWLSADHIEVSETDAGVVIGVPSNNQTTTLAGVTLADLAPDNFTFLDPTAAEEVIALVGGSGGTGGGHGGGGQGSGGHGGGQDHQMVMINLNSPSRTIDGFDPSTDMVHLEGGITGARLEIFEESGDALGQTVRIVVLDGAGNPASTTILTGVGLSDLSLANFSIAEQSALDEVAGAIGATITDPGSSGGYAITYDNDGSAPPTVTGTSPAGGRDFRADINADDIVGFDPATDRLDFGSTSVHGLILTKTPAGEIGIDSPWSDAIQIVQGIGYDEVGIDSFGVVGNEHLRQDLGAVVSWEQGVGPRDADTVYIRSHEYGSSTVIPDFDPQTDKISFLYFGTRERLSVEDTPDGLVISSLPTGQSFTFTGLELADLVPGQVEFHFDQVMEDNLEVPFGFDQNDVSLVDRTMLLTPEAPAGETTDGFQVRQGDFTPGGGTGGGTGDGGSGGGTGGGSGGGTGGGSGSGTGGGTGTGRDTIAITWAWASDDVIVGFDPSVDRIDFGNVGPDHFAITEAPDGDLVIEVLNNGGQTYRFDGLSADEVTRETLQAADWNAGAISAALADLESLV